MRALAMAAAVLGFSLAAGSARALGPYSVGIEGGVSGYTGALGKQVMPGGSWGLRVEGRISRALGLGVAYSGSANELSQTQGQEPASLLRRHGASMSLRLSPGEKGLQPFAQVGAGVAGFSSRRAPADVADASDLAIELPASAGMMWRGGAFNAGLQLGYSTFLGEDVLAARGDLVQGSVLIGARF